MSVTGRGTAPLAARQRKHHPLIVPKCPRRIYGCIQPVNAPRSSRVLLLLLAAAATAATAALHFLPPSLVYWRFVHCRHILGAECTALPRGTVCKQGSSPGGLQAAAGLAQGGRQARSKAPDQHRA